MTKKKPLEWLDTDWGMWPDCTECIDLISSPFFMESVYSVSIEHSGEPSNLAKRTINRFHANGHKEGG